MESKHILPFRPNPEAVPSRTRTASAKHLEYSRECTCFRVWLAQQANYERGSTYEHAYNNCVSMDADQLYSILQVETHYWGKNAEYYDAISTRLAEKTSAYTEPVILQFPRL